MLCKVHVELGDFNETRNAIIIRMHEERPIENSFQVLSVFLPYWRRVIILTAMHNLEAANGSLISSCSLGSRGTCKPALTCLALMLFVVAKLQSLYCAHLDVV
jgi:hypothetical protein